MDAFYLFNIGKNYEAYKCLGSFREEDGSYRFAVWAPQAQAVSVVGDFCGWSGEGYFLQRQEQTGIWTGQIPETADWQRYKYRIVGADGSVELKADPFARHHETRPGTASILYPGLNYVWGDADYYRNLPAATEPGPLNIYEMHWGSWRRYEDGHTYNYRELAPELVAYLSDMGYNAVEFLPLNEYPLDDSWGYQVTGYFAITSRYGTPEDFCYLVDQLHQAGIRVIMDWVPAHFPKDGFGLRRFDGSCCYEYASEDLGERREWGTLVFDYGKKEVVSFLLSSAWYWLEECHIDGLRVDAVSSMLYLNYGDERKQLRNREGGEHNLEAIDFLRNLNGLIAREKPQVLRIAEEATAYPGVTSPVEEGGLGFSHKWNMGWMHDTLDYMCLDYIYRPSHHNRMTFSMTYAFEERYVLAFSHDEVVHGKRSLLDRMPGDLWRKFACLRMMLMYQMAHPGAKLNFMGYEIGQFIEWRFKEQLEWFLLQYERHWQLKDFVRQLNRLYLSEPCFWADDQSWTGFHWEQVDDAANSVLAFSRQDREGHQLVTVLNMTPKTWDSYRVPMPRHGRYRLLLNSDELAYGGSGNLGAPAEGRIFTTEIRNREAAQRQERQRLSLARKEEAQLENCRLELYKARDNYLQQLRHMGQQGLLAEREQGLLRQKIHQLDGLYRPPMAEADRRPMLDMHLPPLAGLYFLYEGEAQ